jgi:hypothetical protein
MDDCGLYIFGQFSGYNCLTDQPAAKLEIADIVRIEPLQDFADALVQSTRPQEMAIGLCRGGEAVREADSPRAQLAGHLTQRGVLAANQRHVIDAQFVEPADLVGGRRVHGMISSR